VAFEPKRDPRRILREWGGGGGGLDLFTLTHTQSNTGTHQDKVTKRWQLLNYHHAAVVKASLPHLSSSAAHKLKEHRVYFCLIITRHP